MFQYGEEKYGEEKAQRSLQYLPIPGGRVHRGHRHVLFSVSIVRRRCNGHEKKHWRVSLKIRKSVFTLAQVDQSRCGASCHGDIQKPSRHSSGQSALGHLACGIQSCSGDFQSQSFSDYLEVFTKNNIF